MCFCMLETKTVLRWKCDTTVPVTGSTQELHQGLHQHILRPEMKKCELLHYIKYCALFKSKALANSLSLVKYGVPHVFMR